METGAVLIGLAQIGVALAGITTIASVMVNTSVTTSRNLFIVRIISVLLFSISLLLASLAPILVSSAGVEGNRLWQIAAIVVQPWVLFLACIGFFYLNPMVLRDPKNNWLQTIVSNLLGMAAAITLITSIFSEQAQFTYMLALMATLLGAVFMMTALVFSFPIFERIFVKDKSKIEDKVNAE